MKCGEKGHETALGKPCEQNIAADAVGCLWHSRTPEQRAVLAMKGGIASRMRRGLPADYQMTAFDNRESVIRFAEDMARRVLVEDVDPRRVDVALRAAQVALSGFAAATQEKLVDALTRMEYGGAAAVLLERLSASLATGRTRPLPGKVLRLPEGGGEPA
jgi:hypothetical protein